MRKIIIVLIAVVLVGSYAVLSEPTQPAGTVKDNFGENWSR